MRITTKGEVIEDIIRHDAQYFARFEADITPGRHGPDDSTDDDGHYLESRAVAKLEGRTHRGVIIDILNGTPKDQVLQLIDKLRGFIERTEESYFNFPVFELEAGRVTDETRF